jgi:hypothetical protein
MSAQLWVEIQQIPMMPRAFSVIYEQLCSQFNTEFLTFLFRSLCVPFMLQNNAQFPILREKFNISLPEYPNR